MVQKIKSFFLILVLFSTVGLNSLFANDSDYLIYSDINKVPTKKAALVSGGPIAGINKVFVGTENGEVFAFNAETGELDWQGKVKGVLHCFTEDLAMAEAAIELGFYISFSGIVTFKSAR